LPDPSSLLWQFVHGARGNGSARLESPARVAQRLAQRFPFDTASLQFFTLVYGVLDLQTHELTYVSAGHPNLIHHPKGQPPRPLEAAGFPIGLGDEQYEQSVVRIAPGDRLIAFSDGISEALNPSLEAFGQSRVLEALEGTRDDSIDITLHVLSTTVEQWSAGGDRRDDESVLAMERV
jgi:sigma-B regulation protein RsbU (phosphoserine phosphatase)